MTGITSYLGFGSLQMLSIDRIDHAHHLPRHLFHFGVFIKPLHGIVTVTALHSKRFGKSLHDGLDLLLVHTRW